MKILAIFLLVPVLAWAQIDFEAMAPNTWAHVLTTGSYPTVSVETHLAFDTSGYAYMLGSCSYGGTAGGTHNNDVYRFDLKSGESVKLYGCGTNPWPGGCQGGQVYDPTRNCVWFGPGNNAVCRTSGVLWFPNLAYYGGLYRMQCPSGPMEKVRDEALGGAFYLYDSTNDYVISVHDDYWWGCRLDIYDATNDTFYVVHTPQGFNNQTSPWLVPCCFDTKRGLVVIARWGGDTATILQDIWFYNTTLKTWSKKTPSNVPPPYNVPLVYEPLLDKYVLVGTDAKGAAGAGDPHPQVWVYDYDANEWTERPRGAQHYDTLAPETSTWPPLRTYCGSFGFVSKYGVIANWGGLPTTLPPASIWQEKTRHPVWAFKLGETDPAVVENKRSAPVREAFTLSACPNPFAGSVGLAVTGKCDGLRIYDPSGRLAADLTPIAGSIRWNASGMPAGVYLVRAQSGARTLVKRIVLAGL